MYKPELRPMIGIETMISFEPAIGLGHHFAAGVSKIGIWRLG